MRKERKYGQEERKKLKRRKQQKTVGAEGRLEREGMEKKKSKEEGVLHTEKFTPSLPDLHLQVGRFL